MLASSEIEAEWAQEGKGMLAHKSVNEIAVICKSLKFISAVALTRESNFDPLLRTCKYWDLNSNHVGQNILQTHPISL
jgi:hypothetical protein